jgi:hypothetical protein
MTIRQKLVAFLFAGLFWHGGYVMAADQTKNQAKSECETLMSSVLPFAQQMLSQHGEFFPFGGAMRVDGQIISVAGYDGTEHPPSTEIIRLIKAGLVDGARNKEYKATSLVYDVRVRLPANGEISDAIAVSLNHRENYSVIVIFPYHITDGKLILGTAYAQAGESDIFAPK